MLRCAFTTAVLALIMFSGCGISGGGNDDRVPRLYVAKIYPSTGELDLATLENPPTDTDRQLTTGAGPTGAGAVEIHFAQPGRLDYSSLFVGGVIHPTFVDPSKIQILWRQPGGWSSVGISAIELIELDGADVVRVVPALPLAPGQYTVLVTELVLDIDGDEMGEGSLHTFWVDTAVDIDPPLVFGVGALVTHGGNQPELPQTEGVLVYFDEPVHPGVITPNTVFVHDVSGPGPVLIPPAPGYPMLKSVHDGRVFPSNAHVVIWRPAASLPPGASVRVTVEGQDFPAGGGASDIYWVTDVAGNGLEDSWVSTHAVESNP